MDFGLAKGPQQSGITRPGAIIGAPEYMSPEQASLGELDARTDQYALGIIAYEMLTGRLPFQDEDPFNIVLKQISREPPPMTLYRSDLQQPLIDVIMKMLAKASGERFGSLTEVIAALKEAVSPGDNE